MDGPNCMSGSRGERERTLLSSQERGAVSDPGVAHAAHGQVSLLSVSPDRPPSQSPQYLVQNLSPWVPCQVPPLWERPWGSDLCCYTP